MPLPEIWRAGLGIAAALGGGQTEAAPGPIPAQLPYQPDNQIVMPGNFEANREAAGLPAFELVPFSQPEAQPAGEPLATENLALVLLTPDADFAAVTYHIRQMEGTVTVEFPGYALMGNIPQNLELDDSGVLGIQRQPFTVDALNQIEDPTQRRWAEAWNKLLEQPGVSQQALTQVEEALVNDALEVPPEEKPTPQISTQDVVDTPDFFTTSEFGLGRVAVDIVTPESTGPASTEDWTQEELDQVLAENLNAFHWLATRYPQALLSFVIAESSAVPIPVSQEPINGSSQGAWITEALQQKGFTEGSYFFKAYANNNFLREHYKTLWGATMFVVDSSNDPDNEFTDGRFAYAYLGGPFLVMTLGNDGYWVMNMDAVAAHEFLHLLWALDQYYSAYKSCTMRSGYLDVENQNSQYGGCFSNVTSIMRGQTWPFTYGNQNPAPAGIDPYGAGQAGWRDTWKVACEENQWVSGEDKLLDPAGGLCYQATVLPSGEISVTTELKPLASAVINGNSTLRLNRLEGVWAKSQGKLFQAQEMGIGPDGQQLVALILLPAGQEYVDLCFGTILGNPCYRIVGGKIFLPVIQTQNAIVRP